jgi:polyisoprenoid-binding protein YceI
MNPTRTLVMRQILPARLARQALLAILPVVFLAVVIFAFMAFAVPATSRTPAVIDPARTSISFEIDAIGWPTTRGVFKSFDGKINVDLEQPARSSVIFRVDAASVDAGSSGVTGYIKSEAMLNVAKFPTIAFSSSAVQRTGERSVRVTGDMSFFGTTLPASFDVDVDRQGQGKVLSFTARGVLKRSTFGFISGQPLISDDVKITVATVGKIE